jgi:hypothetical protein
MKANSNEPEEDPLRVLKGVGAVALLFWLGNLVFGMVTSACGEFGSRLGDSFGAVSALFSSAAVAGAIYAVILQQRQYHDAKKQAATSEKHQQSLAEIEALSAYSQCLAACAQSVAAQAANSESRFLNISILEAEKLGITDSNLYQDYVNDRLELQGKLAENMASYSERANELLIELMAALRIMKTLPIIATTISHQSETSMSKADSKIK